MKCRVDPLESGHQNFPTTASQWHNHKNTQYFTHLPQPAMMQAYIRQGCHQGPHKEGKWSQSKKKKVIKTNCFVTHLLCPQSCKSSNQLLTWRERVWQPEQWMQSRRVAPPGHQRGNSFVKSIQQHLLLGHKLRSRGWIRGMCIKSALLSWFPHFFLVYTKVFVIYTHLITVGH